MKKNLILSVFLCFYFLGLNAQQIKTANKYEFIKPEDIKYSYTQVKRIYKNVEKNIPIFNFDTTKQSPNLFETIFKAVQNEQIKCYATGEFEEQITIEKIKEKMDFLTDTEKSLKSNRDFDLICQNEIHSYLVKELFIYGAGNKLIQRRTIGIAPIRKYYSSYPSFRVLFWIFYPDIADILAQTGTLDEIFYKQAYQAETLCMLQK